MENSDFSAMHDHVDRLSGRHGVIVVPPDGPDGNWLVSVAVWDDDDEQYRSTGEGPILDSGEEAMTEAAAVVEWLQSLDAGVDPEQSWSTIQRTRAAAERGDDRPRPWGRF